MMLVLYDVGSALTVQVQKRIVKKKGILMKKRTTNILLTMFLSVVASVMATAQTTKQKLPPAPPTPGTMHLQPGNGAGFSMEKASADSANATTDFTGSTYWADGWNFIHPQYCQTYYSGGYPYLIVYAQGGGYFYTTDLPFQTLISPACQTGNWLAFYVTDNYSFSNVFTYTYK